VICQLLYHAEDCNILIVILEKLPFRKFQRIRQLSRFQNIRHRRVRFLWAPKILVINDSSKK